MQRIEYKILFYSKLQLRLTVIF